MVAAILAIVTSGRKSLAANYPCCGFSLNSVSFFLIGYNAENKEHSNQEIILIVDCV